VTIDRVWIGNQIYWTLTLVTTNNYDSLAEWHSKDHYNYSTHEVFSAFSSRCFVAASNGGRSTSSGFPNSPPSHLLRVRVILRLVVSRQSVRLGAKFLEAHHRSSFFATGPLRSLSLCNILSNKRMDLSLLCRYRTYNMFLKILPCVLHRSPCQHRLCRADHVYLTYLMLQRQLSHFNGRKLDSLQVYLLYFLSGVVLSYAANMFILMILYDFCLSPAQFCYTIV
jgi:hypothetical protein